MCRYQVQSVYDAALLEYNNSICDSFLAEIHTHKWWSTLKIYFWCEFSLPPIQTDYSSDTFDQSKITEIFLHFLKNKQSDQDFDLLPSCFPNPKFTYFAFKPFEI